MENESQKKLEENLLQLREELIEVKRLLHMCKVGFEAIQETGNSRVADVFLDELNSSL